MFQLTGAFAEFERSIIRQRVYAGLKRAVQQGKRLGMGHDEWDPLGLRNDSAPHLLFWFSHSWYQERKQQ
jgi:hypothetical protein